MTPTDWTAVDAELGRLLDLGPDARAARLASLSEADRAAVEPLLAVALADDPLLDRTGGAAEAVGTGDLPGIEPGQRLGPYRLGALIGEGGMGRVYQARRADGAFDKTVAVKVVRRSLTLAGGDVLARLRRERALLATLDHPGIARLVDGGETDDGVPYLVTDFVDGEPITTWAAARELGLHGRIRLLIEVARAVDHAHRRFVVHRDLKPSNVLVTDADGPPRPVVLDFGIAKLVEGAESEATEAFPLTQTGMRLLTPAYAAPELYDPTATVTTAVDVYGLGALLYELLTGRRPHDDAPTAGPPTVEPTRPSRVAATANDGAVAPTRAQALRGDLDVICLKALHPDPARRYATAADLADDLERHLAGLPVEARPDSRAYVVGRFVRRNRGVVAAAAVAVFALVGGLSATLVSLSNERAALAEATASGDRAGEAARLLGDLFKSAEPGASGDGDMTVREALDRGLTRISTVEPASLRGYLYTVLGASYLEIGDFERSDSLLTASVALLDGSDASPAVRALSLKNLAQNYTMRGDARRGLPLLLQADSLARQGARPDSALLLDIATSVSWTYRDMGQLQDAIEWAERSVELSQSSSRPAERAAALSSLSRTYFYEGRLDEAIETTREAIRLYETEEGPDGASVGVLSSQMAHNLMASGRLDDAMPYARRAVRIARLVYDADHVRRFESMGLLGQLLEVAGELREAEAYYDSTVTIGRGLPAARTATGMSMATSLAQVRVDLGRYRAAERAGLEAIQIGESLPPDATRLDELVAMARLQTGLAMHHQGKRASRAMLAGALDRIEAFPPQVRSAWAEDSDVREAEQVVGRLRRGG
ncbi:protein kinase domain-containing protein [Rubrivirga sp. IMCC43871]|uniref:protein kinase domain-containing protein n=1 Tax=Rubrivirga sp. IMCC43871 TaxID=3391575 RepID=UPI00398F9399